MKLFLKELGSLILYIIGIGLISIPMWTVVTLFMPIWLPLIFREYELIPMFAIGFFLMGVTIAPFVWFDDFQHEKARRRIISDKPLICRDFPLSHHFPRQ